MLTGDQFVQLINAVLIFAGGVISTWLTVEYRNRKRITKKLTPEDREAFLFDRYEKALSEVDDDVKILRQINNEQSDQIEKMQGTIDTLRKELDKAQKINHSLLLANINLLKGNQTAEDEA